MRNIIASLGLGVAVLFGQPVVADPARPVVVELFTSQGCSACPPADALLAEMAARDDVIALALHVDYWDYIGWADTFASGQFTRRQQAYARAAGQRMVYTPQMIIGGEARVQGHAPMEVAEQIMDQRALAYPVEVTLTRQEDGGLRITAVTRDAALVAGEGAEAPVMVVQLVRYMPLQTVEIRRGENAGRTVDYTNIVTEWLRVGEWTGAEPFELDLTDNSPDPAVAIVQRAGPGAILGAARLD